MCAQEHLNLKSNDCINSYPALLFVSMYCSVYPNFIILLCNNLIIDLKYSENLHLILICNVSDLVLTCNVSDPPPHCTMVPALLCECSARPGVLYSVRPGVRTPTAGTRGQPRPQHLLTMTTPGCLASLSGGI